MIHGKRVVVVMPAYNAEATLDQTLRDVPRDVVDEILLVDDASQDRTVEKARQAGLRVIVHPKNRGYGGNQKTCYQEALRLGADIVVMVHPDYQYAPQLITTLASAIASGLYDVALGSRILGVGARKGGMPLYKFLFNRLLTLLQNLLLRHKLSEYHTGFRAFSRNVLLELPLEENGDNFIFDNQMLAQAIFFGHEICEVTCPTRYFAQASSIPFWPSVRYGFGVLKTSLQYCLAKWAIHTAPIFSPQGKRLQPSK